MLRYIVLILSFVSLLVANIPYNTYGNDLIDDGRQYFLTDALGSTRALVDSAEMLTDTYDYKPYGELSHHEGTSETSFLFTGEQYDNETSNYYLRARYYDPATSRFLSRDTYDGKLIDPLSQNRYLYAAGNPVMYVDPSGHFTMMSTSFGIATIAELYTIPNSVNFLFGSKSNTPKWYQLSFSKKDYYDGVILVATEYFTPGHGNLISLVNKLDFLSDEEREEYITSAHIIWGMGYYPSAPALTTLVQEASFLLLAKFAITQNEINRLLGRN